jgi:hypothetical protein
VEERLDQRRREHGVDGITPEPSEVDQAVLKRVPGKEEERDATESGPAEDAPFHGSAPAHAESRGALHVDQCGSDLTSFPHFSSKRLRSSEEPYFAKS